MILDIILFVLIVISYWWNLQRIIINQEETQHEVNRLLKLIGGIESNVKDHLDWHSRQREKVIPILGEVKIDKRLKRGKHVKKNA